MKLIKDVILVYNTSDKELDKGAGYKCTIY